MTLDDDRWPYPANYERVESAFDKGAEACKKHPPKRSGGTWSRELGLNPYDFETDEYESWDEGYEAEAARAIVDEARSA